MRKVVKYTLLFVLLWHTNCWGHNTNFTEIFSGPEDYVGVWGEYFFGFYPKVEISYNNGEYTFIVVADDNDGSTIVETRKIHNGIIYITEKAYDDREKLDRQGYRGISEERSYKADSGYPKSGTFYYDKEIIRRTYSIKITEDGVVLELISIHSDYFLYGRKTYAETDTDRDETTILEKKK